jgi:hypothetical protein
MGHETLRWLLIAAGAGQVGLVFASLMIPKVLHWKEEMAKLRPLTRQVYWTYAAYILTINLSFGLLSLLAPHWLMDKSPLAGAVTAFISAYWGARVIIQFTYYDRSGAPPGAVFKLLEAALVLLFVYLSLVYGHVAVATFA